MNTYKKGFSILELVVAMFLLTIVVGTGILIIAGNLNIMQKSNEILLAAAVAQYYAESLDLIDFPPVYVDRQTDYPKKISETEPLTTSYEVKSPDPNFKVYSGCVWYSASGNDDLTEIDTDKVALRKIRIEVRRAKDGYVLIKQPIFTTRNGIY